MGTKLQPFNTKSVLTYLSSASMPVTMTFAPRAPDCHLDVNGNLVGPFKTVEYTYTQKPFGLTIQQSGGRVIVVSARPVGLRRLGVVPHSQVLSVDHLRANDGLNKMSFVDHLMTASLPVKMTFSVPVWAVPVATGGEIASALDTPAAATPVSFYTAADLESDNEKLDASPGCSCTIG